MSEYVAKMEGLIDGWRDEMFERLRGWIAIDSVSGERSGPNAPFGEGARRVLDQFLIDAQDMGFATRDCDGYAGDAQMGEGEQTMGILAHLDVVPAGDGWTKNPWGGEMVDGKFYGRGTEDDKGPAMAALYAMRAVREAGVPLKHAVRLIVGCDEETGMSDMRYYASKWKMPDYGFSPDASYPLINIEKGGVNMVLSHYTAEEGEAELPVLQLYAGERPNVVPAAAWALVKGDAQTLEAQLKAVCEKHPGFKLRVQDAGEGKAKICAEGVLAHAAVPHTGVNAAGMLLVALKELGAGGASREAIALLADKVGMETDGTSLGIKTADELSGALTCNLGILRYDGHCIEATLDIRYPLCAEEPAILGQTALAVKPLMGVRCSSSHTPLHVPADHEVVKGLLEVYHEATGLPAYAIAIGGGTYSRMMPNTVAFGISFPGDPEVCHIADEYVDVEKFVLSVKIMARAIARLAGKTE